MIFAGNSNITSFRPQGLKAASNEPTSVHWVGALQINHFLDGHPAGSKVRGLFAAEHGWKFLSIGTHDVFALCQVTAQDKQKEYLSSLRERYRQVFSEFHASGRFAWLVFPQPLHQISFPGLGPKEILAISHLFYDAIGAVCKELNIPIIDPCNAIVDKRGEPLPQFVQGDGIHLNVKGIRIYLEKITALTGIDINLTSREAPFEPASETESFCSLLLDELGLPLQAGLSRNDFNNQLVVFVTNLLRNRGLEVEVDDETELVGSGLLDSLSLVQVYTYATDLLKMEISFDVDLRILNSVAKIADFLLEKKEKLGIAYREDLTQQDFFLSLRGDAVDQPQRDGILEADQRIAAMSDVMFQNFQREAAIASHGVLFRYGVILFWIALNKASRGNYRGGLEYIEAASDRRRAFPFQSPRTDSYIAEWRVKESDPNRRKMIWEMEVDASVLRVASSGEDEWKKEYRNILSLAERGDLHQSVLELERLAHVNPGIALFANDLGVLYTRLGNREKALAAYQKAASLEPANITFLKDLSEFLTGGTANAATLLQPEIQTLWDSDRTVNSEEDLLIQLRGRNICDKVKVLYVVGAHAFQERALLDNLFPQLERIYLFEPIPEFVKHLRKVTKNDRRIKVFQYAISDSDGKAEFYLTNNDAASSSLLPLGKYKEMFPHVAVVKTIKVDAKRLGSVISAHQLPQPDMLFLDVQGAEYRILSSMTSELLSKISIIYTEVSTEEVYKGARPLAAIRELLAGQFAFLGFAPITNNIRAHGNALFINTVDLSLLHQQSSRTSADISSSSGQNLYSEDTFENASVNTLTGMADRQQIDLAYQKVKIQLNEGRKDQAILELENLLKAQPDYKVAHNDLGVLYTQSGNNERALQHYEAAVKYQPDNATFVKNLADFYYIVRKDTEKALQMYIKGLSINPEDVEILMALGNISFEKDQLEKARDFYKRVIKIDPQNKNALKIIHLLNNKNQVMMPEQADAPTTDVVSQPEGYLVSAIISTYNSERLIRECIEDLEAQTIANRLEIVVVDSCSQQNEKTIIEELQKKYFNIKYIRTEERETVYAAWNRGIKAATGTYISNANTDDRHRRDAFEIMARALDEHPEMGAVYADSLITDTENETFDRSSATTYFNRPDFNLRQMLIFCLFGPHPMWRRSVHEKVGFFNTDFVVAGDYDLFLNMAWKCGAIHIREPLGLYLKSNTSIEHSGRNRCVEETSLILRHFRSVIPIEEIYKDLKTYPDQKGARAACLADQGNCCLLGDLPDPEQAVIYYRQAIEVGERSPEIMCNMGIALCINGMPDEGKEILKELKDVHHLAKKNLDIINKKIKKGRKLNVHQLSIFDMNHPVVNVAKKGQGLKLINSKLIVEQSDKVYWVGQEMITFLPDKLGTPFNKHPDTPMVSVVVRTYNRPDFLSSCLESIADQTLKNIEAIVVNDGGSDVASILDTFQGHLKIVYLRHPSNLGRTAALNSALKAATGKYIAYLDDDDIYYPRHLETLVDELEKGRFKVAYSDALEVMQSHSNGRYRDMQKQLVYSQDFNRDLLLKTNYIPNLNVVHRRDCLEEVEPFDENMKVLEDWDFWIRMSRKFDFIHVPTLTAEYHVRTDATNATTFEGATFPEHRQRVWEKHRHVIEETFGKRESQSTSIVILTFNELKYTRECVESIKKHTPEPHEIIFVDNGSTDGTSKWLKNFVKNNSSYRLIENKKNFGFSKGCNQGIEASSGDYILLLNNDVVVTENWLAGMLECVNSAADIGIVGPMTNSISGPQKVPEIGYSSIDDLAVHARNFREKNRHRRIPYRRVVGFCMLFKQQLIEEIGLLDESFGSGNFEDDDFCLRASLAGYQNVIAGDVFIHHYGSRTFAGNRIDYGSSLTGNRKVFTEKWSGKDAVERFGKKLITENAITITDDFYRQGHIKKATASMLDALKQAPGDRCLYFKFAEMLIDAKRYNDALEILESAHQEGADARQLALIGYCEEALERGEKAHEYAERALVIDPSMPLALNVKGVVAYKKGEQDSAEGLFKKAIESDPSFGESYTNLGSLKWAAGEHIEALDLFERGFILSPTVGDVVTAYHSAVAETNSFERAEPVFREAKALHPNDKRIAFLMIAVLIKQEKHEQAMHDIEQAMMQFGIDDGILAAAQEIRAKTGPLAVRPGSTRRSLSLCMIVKNEELNLAKCLMSVKPVVDEIIVVDTGSTDKTKAIASALGAKVFDFPWTNDFSEARNYSLSQASGGWILVLDADEVVSPLDHDKLKKLIKNTAGKRVAYNMVTRNYTDQAGSKDWSANEGNYIHEEVGRGWIPSPKVRLFVNDKRINFVNPVHELVEPTLEKLGIKLKTCDVPVHHYGRLNRDKLIAKGKEYYRLGIAKIEKTKDSYNALRELAIQAAEIGEYAEALNVWEKVIELKPNDATAFMNMGFAFLMMQQYDKVVEHSKKAMELDPDLREAALNYAAAELIAGDVGKAIATLEGILQKHHDYPPAMGRLVAAYMISGRKEEGLRYLDRLNTKGFDCAGMLEEQSRAFFSIGKIEQAAVLLQAAIEKGMANGRIQALLGECQEKMKSRTRVVVSNDPSGMLAVQG